MLSMRHLVGALCFAVIGNGITASAQDTEDSTVISGNFDLTMSSVDATGIDAAFDSNPEVGTALASGIATSLRIDTSMVSVTGVSMSGPNVQIVYVVTVPAGSPVPDLDMTGATTEELSELMENINAQMTTYGLTYVVTAVSPSTDTEDSEEDTEESVISGNFDLTMSSEDATQFIAVYESNPSVRTALVSGIATSLRIDISMVTVTGVSMSATGSSVQIAYIITVPAGSSVTVTASDITGSTTELMTNINTQMTTNGLTYVVTGASAPPPTGATITVAPGTTPAAGVTLAPSETPAPVVTSAPAETPAPGVVLRPGQTPAPGAAFTPTPDGETTTESTFSPVLIVISIVAACGGLALLGFIIHSCTGKTTYKKAGKRALVKPVAATPTRDEESQALLSSSSSAQMQRFATPPLLAAPTPRTVAPQPQYQLVSTQAAPPPVHTVAPTVRAVVEAPPQVVHTVAPTVQSFVEAPREVVHTVAQPQVTYAAAPTVVEAQPQVVHTVAQPQVTYAAAPTVVEAQPQVTYAAAPTVVEAQQQVSYAVATQPQVSYAVAPSTTIVPEQAMTMATPSMTYAAPTSPLQVVAGSPGVLGYTAPGLPGLR